MHDLDSSPINHLSLCTGGAGLDLALRLAVPALRTVCAVEIEASAVARLAENMQAGCLDDAPIWSDVKTFDGKAWRGCVDIVSGGYPCQPFSFAGKRNGTSDPRHLWPDVARIVREVRPTLCFFENVPGHIGLGFGEVKGTLEGLGYRVESGIFSAEEVGANHRRERLFIMAYSHGQQTERFDSGGFLGEAHRESDSVANSPRLGRGRRDHGNAGGSGRPLQTEGSCGELENTAMDGRRETGSREPCESGELADTESERCGEAGRLRWSRSEERLGGAGENLAFSEGQGLQKRQRGEAAELAGPRQSGGELADTSNNGHEQPGDSRDGWCGSPHHCSFPPPPNATQAWRDILREDPSLEPALCGGSDGMAWRVDRLRILGNGVIPVVGALAFLCLWSRFEESLK